MVGTPRLCPPGDVPRVGFREAPFSWERWREIAEEQARADFVWLGAPRYEEALSDFLRRFEAARETIEELEEYGDARAVYGVMVDATLSAFTMTFYPDDLKQSESAIAARLEAAQAGAQKLAALTEEELWALKPWLSRILKPGERPTQLLVTAWRSWSVRASISC